MGEKFETEEDPLGYNALYNSIQKLIEHKEKASQEKMVWKKFTEILVERMHNGKIKKSEIEYYDNLYKRVCLGDPQAWEEVLSTDLDDLKIKKVKQKSIVIR